MEINTVNSLKFVSIVHTRNDNSPSNYVSKVVDNETGDVIRQVPTDSQMSFKKSMAENSIIDVYV